MKDLSGKVAFITGASSGIGMACAYRFAKAGCNLLLAARRTELLLELKASLGNQFEVSVKCLNIDVRDFDAVSTSVNALESPWNDIEILINNAGLARGLSKLHEGSLDDWNEMIDTNVKGLLHVSRAVIPNMVKRGSGHIVNIGSIAGHEVYPGGNVYCASKHAVDAITKGMRMDLNGTNVRVTTIDPGLVRTEFSIVRYRGDEKKATATYSGMEPLAPEDVADAVFYAVSRSDNVVVAEMQLLPLAQAGAMIVDRKL